MDGFGIVPGHFVAPNAIAATELINQKRIYRAVC